MSGVGSTEPPGSGGAGLAGAGAGISDWDQLAREKQQRYEVSHGDLDERAVVRLGNLAYAAGLSLLMTGSPSAAEWLLLAAEHWRTSWDLGERRDSWGRPVGAVKAALLAGDEATVAELAGWTLSLGAADASSPIGLYAASLAFLAKRRDDDAAPLAAALRRSDDFPCDVAEALAALAAGDKAGFLRAVDEVVRSFETRHEYLEDVAVADTALVLCELARRHGLACELSPSPVLPAGTSRSRPARSRDGTRS